MSLFAALHRAIDAERSAPSLPGHPDGIDASRAEAVALAIFHDADRLADWECGQGPDVPPAVAVILERKIAARNVAEDRHAHL